MRGSTRAHADEHVVRGVSGQRELQWSAFGAELAHALLCHGFQNILELEALHGCLPIHLRLHLQPPCL